MTIDLDALIASAESMTPDEIHDHPMAALDKLRALSRELRQERERAGSLTTQRDTARHESVEWEDAFARTEVALSRAEETIEAIRTWWMGEDAPKVTLRQHVAMKAIFTEYDKQKAGLS